MLAQQLDASLLLLHVVDEQQPQEIVDGQAERARSALEARQLTTSAEISLRFGKPHRTIARAVSEWDADLVVLGAYRERTGDRFFGTTAEHVIGTARRPVLIVNGEPTDPYRDVLLASDLSDRFAQVALVTQQLGLLDGVRASIVHAIGHAADALLYSSGATQAEMDQLLVSRRWSTRRDLIAQLDAAGLDSAQFRIIQRHGTPFDAIASVVHEAKPQLLVLGATRHPTLKRLLGASVANEVLRGIDCDVLMVAASATRQVRAGSQRAVERDAMATVWPMHW